MLRITDILDKGQQFLPATDLEMIEKAYIYSATVHQGQVRLSGEPYLTHPLEVAGILTDMKMDAATIVTGLLHDAVEDTYTTIAEIGEAFGKEVAFLVEGLTKLSKISFRSQEEQQAENFRKMILAMSEDIRILIVKLADRLHNMRTLGYQPPERQRSIAEETLEIYAPLAHRLGINWLKMELEDLSFKYLDPPAYDDLLKRVAKTKEKRDQYTEEVKGLIKQELENFGVSAEVEGRAKHLYSIYQKMKEQHINFDEVYDLIAFRVILDSDDDKGCYEVLSIVHALWKPVPYRFKDYIGMPKANNYRSLHTTVIGPYGERVEIQIRTRVMHKWAEEGIAAHWRYKEGGGTYQSKDHEQIKKLRELLDLQHESANPREFMSNLKMALFPDEVYVFTPKGDVKSFPKGATPVDFAYSVHSDVGNQCVGARVNRSIVPLRYVLKNGDRVEVITQAGHKPSKDWLKFVVTSKAIAKIRSWVKAEEREKSQALGKELLEKEFKKNHLKFSQAQKSEEMKKILQENSLNALDDLFLTVGYGKLSPKSIVNRFIPEEEGKKGKEVPEKKPKTVSSSTASISLTGIDDVLVRFAKCCNPIPGEEIVGYISRGRGITVHTAECPLAMEMDADRLVDVEWNLKEKHTFPVHMRVISSDYKGVLAEISSVISSLDVNISHAEVDTNSNNQAICDFILDVNDLNQYDRVVAQIKKLSNVVSVERIRRQTGISY